MSLNITPTGIPVIAGDITSPSNGDLWYNSVTGKFRKRENGVTYNLEISATSVTTGKAVAIAKSRTLQ